MNEVYETEHVVYEYRVKVGRLSSRDNFVSDAGDLKLDARLSAANVTFRSWKNV